MLPTWYTALFQKKLPCEGFLSCHVLFTLFSMLRTSVLPGSKSSVVSAVAPDDMVSMAIIAMLCNNLMFIAFKLLKLLKPLEPLELLKPLDPSNLSTSSNPSTDTALF